MNQHLQQVVSFIQQNDSLTVDEKNALLKSLKDANKELEITVFKLDRTEKVKKTTAILLEETIEELEQKRKAVEAQNKEFEIEAALEKIRSGSLAMQKSDELNEVVNIVFQKLQDLGIPANSASINIFIEGSNEQDVYVCGESGGTLSTMYYRFPYFEHPFPVDLINARKKDLDFLTLTYPYEEKNSFFNYLFEHSDLKNLPHDIRKLILESNSYAVSMALTKNSMIVINDFGGKLLSGKQVDILKRFAKVFEQSYIRFLDLQKAEAQSRESQIQLALERVRARTMAMQHSNELAAASFVLDTQVRSLGIKTRGCAFNIYGDNESLEWFSSEHGPLPMYKTPRENLFLRYFEKGLSGIPIYVEEFAGDACAAHYEYLCTIPVMGDALRAMIAAGGSFPTRQIDHVIYHKYGYLLFITLEPEPEAHEIFIRFAKVFEQTYTRFLDLQKSEAQAKEAKIEVVLEKIRSRSLAMHHSDELRDVIGMVYMMLNELKVKHDTVAIQVFDFDTKSSVLWPRNTLQNVAPKVVFPYDENIMKGNACHRDLWEAMTTGKSIINKVYTKQEKDQWFEYVFAHNDYTVIEEHSRQFLFQLENFTICFFPEKYSGLYAESWDGTKYSEEDIDVLKKAARVFEQAYVRFIDLQKAEAQSRESQIQLALERVRARTMAMQKSDELSETSVLLFHQLMTLELNVKGCGFNIWEKDEKICTSWMSGPDGELSPPFRLPLTGDPLFIRYYESRQNGEDFWVYETSKEKLTKRYGHLRTIPVLGDAITKELEAGKEIPHFVVDHVVNFPQGNLIFITYERCPDAWDIFKRFGKVFEQTYTRFLDLQKAEAQARESQIEASLERVRAQAMAMHKSDELLNVCEIMYKELKVLGFNEIRNTMIHTFNNKNYFFLDYDFSGSAGGKISQIPTTGFPIIERYLYTIKNNGTETFIEFVFSGKELESWKKIRKETGQLDDPRLESVGTLYYYYYTIGAGDIGISAFSPISPERMQVLERFRNVFHLSYQRYHDIEKAEEQAREAKIEAALERVRSRTLAMQKSEELAETAAVLFQQLIALGIEPNRLYIAIVKNEAGDSEFWITDEDGTKISTAFSSNLNDNLSFSKMFDGWKQQRKSLVIDMQGEELKSYFQHLNSIGVPFKGGLTQKRRVQDVAYFSHGFIGIASPDEQPEETLLLLERFAAVFNLTFTRFNDLKLAEAHAIQAEEDLIKLQTEKKRAEDALTDLRAAQKQLVQSEKMASLGELTAGIAHEIQNPLNFVNNFSEVSNELIDEMKAELSVGNLQLALELADDISHNLEKINHHGKRADGIVKGMLQHSQSSGNTKEPIDINALADEYLRLAYHGLRAKDKQFNATIKTDFDKTIGKIDIIPQDIGRVVLNVLTNAFYAVNEKKKANADKYEPIVTVSTKTVKPPSGGLGVSISVEDNGNGIPKNIVDKIFQPFFTTKPTGQGTGLGLSLAYDIVKAHDGELKVETKEGEGTIFIIHLPKNN